MHPELRLQNVTEIPSLAWPNVGGKDTGRMARQHKGLGAPDAKLRHCAHPEGHLPRNAGLHDTKCLQISSHAMQLDVDDPSSVRYRGRVYVSRCFDAFIKADRGRDDALQASRSLDVTAREGAAPSSSNRTCPVPEALRYRLQGNRHWHPRTSVYRHTIGGRL